jgi:hypothetical protein
MRPSAAVSRYQAVPVEYTDNQVVAGDEHQLPDGRDDVGGGAVALSPALLQQTQFCMAPADPVDQQGEAISEASSSISATSWMTGTQCAS